MKKHLYLLFAFCTIGLSSFGQIKPNYSDLLLTRSFKVFREADFEMAWHILPFLRTRFIEELNDTSSFRNPYDSLSQIVNIRFSSDSLLKTYCWSERSGGCCHSSAVFAQYRTPSGKIRFADLQEGKEGGSDIFPIALHRIEIESRPHYLLLGWGTCCGGKHYETAGLYHMENDTLIQSDSLFGGQTEIYALANRSQKINLSYDDESRMLTYNAYKPDEGSGFFTNEQTTIRWQLTKFGFTKLP